MDLATVKILEEADDNFSVSVFSDAKVHGPRSISKLMHQLLSDAGREHAIIAEQITVNLYPAKMECDQVRKAYEELFEAHLKAYNLLGTLDPGEEKNGIMLIVRATNGLLQELEERFGNPYQPPFVATIDVINGLKIGTPYFIQANPAELRCLEHFVPEDRRERRHKEMIASLVGAIVTAKSASSI